MDFRTNKSPEGIIKEGAFGGMYFRDIYSGVNGKWHKNSWKEFDFLKNIENSIILLIFMMLELINIE